MLNKTDVDWPLVQSDLYDTFFGGKVIVLLGPHLVCTPDHELKKSNMGHQFCPDPASAQERTAASTTDLSMKTAWRGWNVPRPK